MKRIGIDVGGTFTDIVIVDEQTGATSWLKTVTDYTQPADSILRALAATGVAGAEISRVKLGTTLSLNGILTRTGATTGLMTTAGFRDVLEIRRTHRDKLFDLNERLPVPLVPRDLRVEVDERVGADGSVVRPLDEDGVRQAWRRLRSRNVTALAIVFLFSFENPSHEQRALEIVLEEGGAECVFISSEVLPLHREYERTSTTVAAAYVAPLLRGYLEVLAAGLSELGVRQQSLFVMTNAGGTIKSATAAKEPVTSLISGPAGGVEGARWLGKAAGRTRLLTLDMGGTSCDVSGIEDDVPDERLDMRVGGLDIAYPAFDIHTIGAGGGSIAWVDSGGALRVGPTSAGSAPGPACYGWGGTEPTVTDANLVLGRYLPDSLLGGKMGLNTDLARQALRRVAEPLGLSVERAAAGVIRIVNALMVNALRTISVERGRDPREYTLVAFGGSGPVHAADIARELTIPHVLVPPFPGCTSAFGAAMSSTRRDVLRTVSCRSDSLHVARLERLLDDALGEARIALLDEGFDDTNSRIEVWFQLRYAGQAHDLPVKYLNTNIDAASIEDVVARFHALHKQLYGHSFDDVAVEIVTLRVSGLGQQPNLDLWWDWKASGRTDDRVYPDRLVYFEENDEFVMTKIFDRAELEVGVALMGPAVIHQADSTVLVPPAAMVVAHESGNLILSNNQERSSATN